MYYINNFGFCDISCKYNIEYEMYEVNIHF